MIGRIEQIKTLNELLKSLQSEFVAVTGRRRVGKTFLIDTAYEKEICFRMSGIQDGSMSKQLANFMTKLAEVSKKKYPSVANWQDAFQYLKLYCKSINRKSKCVIFLDELPWMNTPKSGFLQLLAHFWNDYLSKEKRFVLVVCGSASSWITKKIINDKGGLHNRLTEIIRLQPFTLKETKLYFDAKNIKYSEQNIALIYMMLGGIPYYLNLIKKGESLHTAIERLCFQTNGVLRNEYDNLFKALFYNASNHEAIVSVLATSKMGLTREQIIKKSKVSAGGPYNRIMEDLILSGFITEDNLYGRKKRGSIYKLTDEYTIFYHRFIKANVKYSKDMWAGIANSQAYKIWCGHAFEALCTKHLDVIKNSLGIANVYTQIHSFNSVGDKSSNGFQIDVVIDRKDDTINLCEMKFYAAAFTITKSYAEELRYRKQQFIEQTNTKKIVQLTFITNHGIKENAYSNELVDQQITLSDIIA
jgi:uncharacterized protein